MGIRSRLAKALALPPGATALTEQQVAGLTPQTANSSNMATPLPRESTDATVPFAPAMPLFPSLINTPRADGRAEPRKSEFPVAWNIQILEQRNVPFRVLREVADGADIIRKCVEVVKATVAGMVWDISINKDAIARVMTEQNITNTAAAKQVRDQYQTEITAAKDFWRSPDRMNGMSFQEWLMMLLEEVMVVDALTIYPNRTADSKNLHSLEILDGTTIKPLLNARGSRPLPPHPAFQQILWGFPRGEFTAAPDADGEFTADDLVYAPRVRRPFTPYGLSPVERCLPLVDLYMKRLQWFRTEFTDGAIPDMMMKSDMEFGNNPELLRGYEQVFNDALGGSMEQRRRMRLLPNGFDPVFSPSSDSKFNSDFDDFIVKSICGHFGVLPTQIGFTPKSGLGGAGHQAGEAASAETLGLRPIITWVSDLLNQLSHRFVGMPQDLQFVFSDGTENDEMAQATRRQTEIFSGQKTWNEIRSEAGLPLFDFPEADAPIIVSGATIVPLSGTFEQVAVDAAAQDNDDADATVAEDETSDAAELELAKFVKWARTEKARSFEFVAVGKELADSLNALVRVDSEAARDYATTLRKAGDARPKVRGGREPFPANHPARAVSDRLNEIYTEKLFSLGSVDAHKLVTDWLASSDNDADAWLRSKNVKVFRSGLTKVLNDLYVESAWMGDRAAASLIATARTQMKAVSATVDWDGWTPGDPTKAAVLLGTGTGDGLRDLLAQSNVTIAGITGTRLDLIGTILSDAMGRGAGVTGTAKEIADAMNTIVTESVERINGTAMSRERAEMIAHTEMTRAGNAAATDHYKAQGVSEVEWQTADAEACEICAGYESDSPFPMDSAPQPPEHPWCGCQLLPVAFDNDDAFEYTPEELAEMEAIDAAAEHPNVEPDTPEDHANVSDQPELATEADVVTEPERDVAEIVQPRYTQEHFEQQATKIIDDVSLNPDGSFKDGYDGYTGTGDKIMERIWREQGFDAKPTIISDAQYEALKQQGWQPAYRGIAASTQELVDEYINAFKTGEPFAGKGMFGNGTYSSFGTEVADRFTQLTASGVKVPHGERMDLLINPNARVIDLQELYDKVEVTRDKLYAQQDRVQDILDREYPRSVVNADGVETYVEFDKWQKTVPPELLKELKDIDNMKRITEDPARWAAMNGYDAVRIVNPVVSMYPRTVVDDTYINILNRSIVAVKGN